MTHPPLATHMVSLPDGVTGNNALGYCSGNSRDPDRPIVLSPLGPAWPRRVMHGTRVVVKWLKLPGQPEFLHILDAETSTTSPLPRRLKHRSSVDIVVINTPRTQHYAADVALYYGSASPPAGNMITITPLGRWRCNMPVGSTVEIRNLSAPGSALKNGVFSSQVSIAKHSSASGRFLKDSPGG